MTNGHTSLELPDFGPLEDRDLTPAGERILAAASTLFYWQGIHAVGVATIAQQAGVTKKTIFDRFGSKEKLVAEYLRRRDRAWRRRLQQAVDKPRQAGDARGVVLATYDALERWVIDENPRGCAFVNALAEITSSEHEGFLVVMRQKEWLAAYFRGLARQISPQKAECMAAQLMILYEGATVVNAINRFDSPIQSATKLVERLM